MFTSLTLKIEQGLTLILGPSGTGKSTLLRLLVRLVEPDSGSITFKGKPLHGYSPLSLRREVALVFQLPRLFEGSVAFNLGYGPALQGKSLSRSEGEALLEQVKLPISLWEADAVELSIGQQQRVSLARALANRPGVLLLDEPTAALDPGSLQTLEQLIGELSENLSVVMVTHSPDQARRLGGRAVLLAQGSAVECGPDLLYHPKTELARAFLAGETLEETS